MIHLRFGAVTAVYTEFYKSQHKLREHQHQRPPRIVGIMQKLKIAWTIGTPIRRGAERRRRARM